MTEAKFAQLLIEELPLKLHDAGADAKVTAVTSRIAMQIASTPSLQSFLSDFGVYQDDSKPDGPVDVELDFLKLPREIIPDLERMLCVHKYSKYAIKKYVKNGQAHTGLRITIDPKDLPGTAYDYSY